MARKKLFMETTQVDARKTAAEIQLVLASAGASSINTDYANGEISGLRWIIRDVAYEMPVRVEPVFKLLTGRYAGAEVRRLEAAK